MAPSDDLSAMLSAMMSDPEQMGQLMQMFSAMQNMGGDSGTSEPAPPPPSQNTGPSQNAGPDLSSVFSMFSAMQGGASSASGAADGANAQSGPDSGASGGNAGFQMDPQMLFQLFQMMNELNSGDDTYSNLLLALRPFLSGARIQALEQLLSFSKIFRLMRLFTPPAQNNVSQQPEQSAPSEEDHE